MNRFTRVVTAALALLAASLVVAGPLDPPAGPVGSTAKPLAEVEPRIAINLANTPGDADSLFRITQPGSYYLTGNITGVSAKKGIEVAAMNVTIDLCGFTVTGVPGSLTGISAEASPAATVKNGTVTDWGNYGVGVGSYGRVMNVTARSNGPVGIYCDQSCVVESCVADSNGDTGIYANAGSTVAGCTARSNGGVGIIASSAAVSRCAARANTVAGMQAMFDSSVTNCISSANNGDGLVISTSLSHTTVVTDSSFCHNGDDGIQVTLNALIRGCTCSGNGDNTATGSGIHVTTGDVRIEGNHCSGNDRGIWVAGSGSVITRNTCSGNATNWEIAANNVYATIVDRSAPASAAVSGNSAANTLGTTDGNANVTH